MNGAAVLDDELTDAEAERWSPPRQPRSHWDLARTMTFPDGPLKGCHWDPETEPVQTAWVRQLDNPRWNKRTRVAPSQRGKSLEAIALPLIRCLVELKQNAAYIMPNLDKLNQNWEGKVRPMMFGCGYGAWLPEKGPGSKGGRPAALTLRNPATGERAGTWYFMAAGGGKETSLASVTALLTATDEGDDFESDGHLKLGEKRAASFGDLGQAVVASTVNDRKGRDGHPILSHYALGTRTRLWFQCPHCAGAGETCGFQPLTWESVVDLGGSSVEECRSQARYVCAHCAARWTEADRRRALTNWREVHAGQSVNAAGVVVGDPPGGAHYSLLSTDLDYLMSSLPSMAEDWWVAERAIADRGDHSLMRIFYHKRLCLDYTGESEALEAAAELSAQSLLRRSQSCKWGPVIRSTDRAEEGTGHTYSRHLCNPPPEAAFCVAFVDVQANRVYWTITAAAMDSSTWDIAWGYELARPDKQPWNKQELFALLDRVHGVLPGYCGTLGLAHIGLDTGDFTDDLMAWLKGKRGTAWRACKGTGRELKPERGDIEGVLYIRDSLHFIDVESTRDIVHSAFRRQNGAPGAAHIPHGLTTAGTDRAYLLHLVGEVTVVDPKTRKTKVKRSGRWDWLDCRRGNEALLRLQLRNLNKPKGPPRKYGNIGSLS